MFCTATLIAISLSAKTVTISCAEGTKLVRSAIVGTAKTPTPIGRFKVYYADDTSGYGANRQYAAFKKHANGSEYAVHGNDSSLPQNGSMGCVRFDQTGIRLNVGATVNISK